MNSVFREKTWIEHRHLLNPSKFKEYELHAAGLGFLNSVNFLKDYKEKFTHIDALTQEVLSSLKKKTTIILVRKSMSEEEKKLLENNNFKLKRTWGTLILEPSKEINLDSNTSKNIRKSEKRLDFLKIDSESDFKEYYDLFKESRKELGFKTPSYKYFLEVKKNKYYLAFAVKSKETNKIVAGIATIHNENYLLEINAARDKKHYYANDYLKWKIIEYCKLQGIKYYDFAGCNPDPKEGTKDFNIKRFKEKWGGDFYYEYTYKR